MSRKNTFDDVFKFVDIRGPDECWPWRGTISRKGLPEFTVDGKKYSAYRVTKWVADGGFNIHDERIVPMHNCKDQITGKPIDDPLCCNPRHTDLGTHEDNQLDMMLKGRSGLTKDMIRDILHYNKEFPDLTHGQLAKKIEFKYEFKVSRQAITDILNQRRRSVLQDAIRAEDAALTQEKKDGDGEQSS